jgi:hypothetical protein
MIATIAGTPTASIIAIITRPQCNTDLRNTIAKAKGGSLAAPPFVS